MRWRNLGWLCLVILPVLAIVGGHVVASPARQATPLQATAFDTRADLEVLADSVFGLGNRPETWTGNYDVNTTTMIADLWFDNEQLANQIFGVDTRPQDTWFGATSPNPALIIRNVRHDLEISANQVLGLNVRPQEWRGAAKIVTCSRTLQNLVDMLTQFYAFRSQTPQSAVDYCRALTGEAEDATTNFSLSAGQRARIPGLILAVRGDLERLADEKLGLNQRPSGWIGNKDESSPTLKGDNLLDLETLADVLLGAGVRPDNWIGAVTNNDAISYVNLRHDLELLADQTMGSGVRPHGWQGGDLTLRCDPLLQNLVFTATDQYQYSAQSIDPNASDYCQQVDASVNQYVENPPISDVLRSPEDVRFSAESNYAFSYLDLGATQYMGIMPAGTQFRAWYRNFGDSTMMFVSGENFALYIDQRFTSLAPEVFNTLPTLEGVVPLTFCDAKWCQGPGPTPTPTGSGALVQLITQSTPPATPNTVEINTTKTLVSWNNIRVTYISDNTESRTAQVALEICTQPAENGVGCEPVNDVFDNATNTQKPVVSQVNGLNVFEFRYGYTNNLLIQGTTLYSNDVWISDPTIR